MLDDDESEKTLTPADVDVENASDQKQIIEMIFNRSVAINHPTFTVKSILNFFLNNTGQKTHSKGKGVRIIKPIKWVQLEHQSHVMAQDETLLILHLAFIRRTSKTNQWSISIINL